MRDASFCEIKPRKNGTIFVMNDYIMLRYDLMVTRARARKG